MSMALEFRKKWRHWLVKTSLRAKLRPFIRICKVIKHVHKSKSECTSSGNDTTCPLFLPLRCPSVSLSLPQASQVYIRSRIGIGTYFVFMTLLRSFLLTWPKSNSIGFNQGLYSALNNTWTFRLLHVSKTLEWWWNLALSMKSTTGLLQLCWSVLTWSSILYRTSSKRVAS